VALASASARVLGTQPDFRAQDASLHPDGDRLLNFPGSPLPWLAVLLHPRIGLVNQFLVQVGLSGRVQRLEPFGMGWVQGSTFAPLASS